MIKISGHNATVSNRKYMEAREEYNKVADMYSGEAGWNLATDKAKEQANWQSRQAAANAGSEANIQARTAGLSKARAANLSAGMAAQTAGNAYTNAYNNAQSQALNYNNAQVQQAGQLLSTEQQEAQNRFEREDANTPFKSLWR